MRFLARGTARSDGLLRCGISTAEAAGWAVGSFTAEAGEWRKEKWVKQLQIDFEITERKSLRRNLPTLVPVQGIAI